MFIQILQTPGLIETKSSGVDIQTGENLSGGCGC